MRLTCWSDRSKLLATFLMGFALIAQGLFAQTETGQITGTITDPSGAAIANAAIEITSTTNGSVRDGKSGADGAYTVTNLLPGEYTVNASATGFSPARKRVTLTVGARLGEDFQLQLGQTATTVEVTETQSQVNTETQTQGQTITQTELRELPNLSRNPYQFVGLTANVSDVGIGTRGAGVAINGQRESSTNILLDGGSNNDEFNGSIGQQIPLDAVQEFSVLTSNFTAEYGRASGGIVNVVSKSGTNQFHGTAYEFNRVSALSSNSFVNNSNDIAKSVFVRNQFGYSVGGPIIKNKLFFFSDTEWTRVRSSATQLAWIPTPQFIGLTAPNTQAFFNAYGQTRPGLNVISSAACGTSLFTCPAGIPAGIPVFNHVSYSVPTDAGGGNPENAWDTFNRVDYNISDRTQFYARYALYSEQDQPGVLSSSPYNNYDLGENYFNHNFIASLIHSFSPAFTSQTKVVFNRLTNLQQGLTSRGLVPTLYIGEGGSGTIGTDSIGLPGYNPFTPGNGGAFGGPQNILQYYEDLSYTFRNHSLRFGGTYDYIRDNRTYAAYQTAVDSLGGAGANVTTGLAQLLAGQLTRIEASVDPQGKFPCVGGVQTPACTITLPATSPNFSRSNRFQEGALYVQDSWKLRPRLTINLGLRWEYFGPQHNKNGNLDSNWYAPGIGFADNSLGQYIRTGGLQIAPNSPVGGLWKSDLGNFGPRVGFAWDIFGDGKSSLRAGYGIVYERNFGNVTFNLIQNPPNYAVLGVPGPITNSNFGPLAGSSGSLALPSVGARIVDPNIKTAYAHTWNTSIERQLGRSAVYALEYSGSKGVNLYAISYPNQAGFGNYILGDPCGASGCTSEPNPNYSQTIGYRGNEGFSLYNSLTNKVTMRNFMNKGLDLTVSYTWSHAIDNLSSTFFESGGEGIASQFDNQNITINNGYFVTGLLDPYHPNLDKGDAEFDIRHRVIVVGNWLVPSKATSSLARAVLGGWSLNPIFNARTGQPFSVFDSSTNSPLGLNTPRASFNGPVPNTGNGTVYVGTPGNADVYNYLTFSPSQIAHPDFSFAPGFTWPSNMSGRDAFRGPGWWDFDLGLSKNTAINERFSLQLRLEAFNLFNHANFYVNGTTADVGAGNSVEGCYGCTGSTYDRRHIQLGAKVIF